MRGAFDLEITDADLDDVLIHKAILLFTQWNDKTTLSRKDILATQRLNTWRPDRSVSLITTRFDLDRLVDGLEAKSAAKITFKFKNVLRVQF